MMLLIEDAEARRLQLEVAEANGPEHGDDTHGEAKVIEVKALVELEVLLSQRRRDKANASPNQGCQN